MLLLEKNIRKTLSSLCELIDRAHKHFHQSDLWIKNDVSSLSYFTVQIVGDKITKNDSLKNTEIFPI